MKRPSRAARASSSTAPASPVRTGRLRRWLGVVVLGLLLVFAGGWGARWAMRAAARRALERRQLEDASLWLDRLDRWGGSGATEWLLRARVLRRMGQVSGALASLEQAAAAGADESDLLRAAVLARAQAGQLPDDARVLRELLAQSPGESQEIYEAFALGRVSTGRVTDAVQVLDDWQRDFPADPLPHYVRGVLQRDIGWSHKAEAEFRAALALDPHHSDAARELAVLVMRSQHYDEAIPLFHTALSGAGDNLPAHVGLAHCHRMLGATTTARQILLPLVAGRHPDVGALAELGRLELMEGHYDAALDLLAQARRTLPRNSEINYAYASALAALGRHEAAATSFRFAIEARRSVRRIAELMELLKSHPDNPDLRCEIARLSLEYGEPRDAAGWAQSVLDRDPQNAAALEIMELLRNTTR
ncbi:MAG: tetratricopeptide repeat protein [Pirellulales bacterium]